MRRPSISAALRQVIAVAVGCLTMTAGCTITSNRSHTRTSTSATAFGPPSTAAPATLPPAITLARYNYQFDVRAGVPDNLPSEHSATPGALVVNMPDFTLPEPEQRRQILSSFALVFPLLPKRPACIKKVELQLRLLGGQGGTTSDRVVTVAGYPSGLVSLAQGHYPPDPTWSPDFLIGNRPRSVVDVGLVSGWVSFDITELYTTWAKGGPFPNGKTIRAGTPMVVKFRPPVYAPAPNGGDVPFVRRFASISAGPANAPRLRWTALADC